MLDAQTCMNDLAQRLRAAFGGRLIYLGLQGSYARGEADGQSDLDVMCVLEGLSTADLDAYGRIIRELREQRGLTQEVLSGLAAVSRSHLAEIETGHTNANVETLWRISEALGMKMSDLIRMVEQAIEREG